MIDKLIGFSIRNKMIIGMFVLALIGWGVYSMKNLTVDAFPDITNNQVQIISQCPTLAAQEVEKFVTYPIELAVQNIPGKQEVRSISRTGLSVVTVVFDDDMDTYLARQLVEDQLDEARENIPEGFAEIRKAPITTGLGEIYHYILRPEKGYEEQYDAMELRSIQDWVVKRQLSGIEGVVEVNSAGGYIRQLEISVDPDKLLAVDLTLNDVLEAVRSNNGNVGASYIEKGDENYFIRGNGMIQNEEDLEIIQVAVRNDVPIYLNQVAEIIDGYPNRYGSVLANGEGEVAAGVVLMVKGGNARLIVERVKERVERVKQSLPEGVELVAITDRSKLIDNTINTVTTNLIEGGLIVILILILFLGNLRAGLIVATVIPLSLCFAFGMMNTFGVTANLMSLGAIDFGVVVDGAVIIVEAILHRLVLRKAGQRLSQEEMDREVLAGAVQIRKSAAFGEIIILIVYLPILTLVGIEGKLFTPMALTVSFAILGALILSLTYVPMMTALFASKKVSDKKNFSDRAMDKLNQWLKTCSGVFIAL